jgi:hypothetical protein
LPLKRGRRVVRYPQYRFILTMEDGYVKGRVPFRHAMRSCPELERTSMAVSCHHHAMRCETGSESIRLSQLSWQLLKERKEVWCTLGARSKGSRSGMSSAHTFGTKSGSAPLLDAVCASPNGERSIFVRVGPLEVLVATNTNHEVRSLRTRKLRTGSELDPREEKPDNWPLA